MYKNLYSKTELLFLIPISIRSLKDWSREYDSKLKQYINSREQFYSEINKEFDVREKIETEVRFNNKSTPWFFNELIGFIEIRIYKQDLQLYFFKVNAKRYSSLMKKKKFLMETSFEYKIKNFKDKNNLELQSCVLNSITEIKKKYPKFKKYYFDTESVVTTLKYFNAI